MSNEKIKVWNRTRHAHDFVFSDSSPQRERKMRIAPQGHAWVPEDEVYYVHSSSRTFSEGLLEIDSMHKELLESLGIEGRSPNTYSIKEFKNILKGNVTKEFKNIISGITERHAVENLVLACRDKDIAMNLNRAKQTFIEKELDIRIFDDEFEKARPVQEE